MAVSTDTNKSRSRGKVDTKEIGRTGLVRLGGHIYDEVLPELRGPRWNRTVREMIDQDSVIGAILFAVEMLIRQVEWKIVAAKIEPKIDPITGKPVKIDPLTGKPVETDPLTGKPKVNPLDPLAEKDALNKKLPPNVSKLPVKKPPTFMERIFALPIPFPAKPGIATPKNPLDLKADPNAEQDPNADPLNPFPPKEEEPFEPADPDTIKAEEIRLFVEQCLDDMEAPFKDTLSEILSFLPWGWSLFEEVYKFRDQDDIDAPLDRKSKFTDGKVGWRKWAIRSQETLWDWKFVPKTDDVEAMVQHLSTGEEFVIPLRKALLFRSTSRKDSPEGKSIFRTAYRSWYFKKKIENIEAIGIERDLAGLPIMYVPRDLLEITNDDEADVDLRNQLQQMIRNIRQDSQAGAIIPTEYDENGNKLFDLQLLTTAGNRQFDTNTIVGRHNRDIAMCVLADFVIMGHDSSTGSFALASNKTEMFARACGTWMNTICDTINSVAIPRLLKLNGIELKYAPKLAHGDIETLDLTELGSYIQKLALAGVPGLDKLSTVNYLFGQAGIPELTQQEYDEAMDDLDSDAPAPPNPNPLDPNNPMDPLADTGGLKPGDNGYQGPNAPVVTQQGNPSTMQKKKPVVAKKNTSFGKPVRIGGRTPSPV